MPPKAVCTPRVVQRGVPDFLRDMKADYQAHIAHVFILHGNVYDAVDNAANDLSIKLVLAAHYDDNIQKALNPNAAGNNKDTGLQATSRALSQKTRIIAFYNTSGGLEF